MPSALFFGFLPPMQQTALQALQKHAPGWEGYFAEEERAAVQYLQRLQPDVVVVDAPYPDLTGINFLTWAQKNLPYPVKIAINEQKNVIEHLRSSGLAQQFLPPTFDAAALGLALQRSLMLRDLLTHGILQRVVTQVRSLPTLPNLYLKIADELNKPDPTPEKVGQIISQDISMTAKVLQIVNSAYFGLPYPVVSPTQATVLLGLEAVRDLVLSIKIFANFDYLKLRHLGLTRLWNHSMLTGIAARQLARRYSSDKKAFEYSFISGLLHDIGKLILADNLPMKYHSSVELASSRGIEFWQAEKEVFGTTHAQVGAYLLWLWNLPEPVLRAVAYHHQPGESSRGRFEPLTAIHIANVCSHQSLSGLGKINPPSLDMDYLNTVGLGGREDELERLCRETLHSEDLKTSH